MNSAVEALGGWRKRAQAAAKKERSEVKAMARNLELLFENEEGKTVRISLEAPVEPADPVQISQVMDEVLSRNVFFSSGGDLVAKKGARIVERTVEDIELS